jgi:hypothetical protein
MSKAAEFISLMFFARNFTHREHLRTTVYARHMALGEFYDAIVDLADKFTEVFQGRYGIVEDVSLDQLDTETDSLTLLQSQVDWIDANRYMIAPVKDTTTQNIIDEIIAQYLHTIYKYRTLM